VSGAEFWVGPPAGPDTYRLVTVLGGGGEGEVWKGVLPLSVGGRSTVAVKIMAAGYGPDVVQRWDRVGHLLRSLSHPGLVRVTDVFCGPVMHRQQAADFSTIAAYVVMDHVDGPTLREWCDENPEATASARLRMLRMVASALDEMHSGAATQVPVAHGDVKPSNVVVREDGGTVLVDLGLTRLTDATGVAGRSTPYAAPELRVPGVLSTPEADRYAFAVTTAQVLTGQPPPLGPDGWLDPAALESLLRASPVTARRPMLVRRIMDVLAAPPEARPWPLRTWLDSAADTLSQVTTSGPTAPLTAAASVTATGRHGPTAVPGPPALEATVVSPAVTGRRRRRWPILVAALVVAMLAGAGLTAYTLRSPGTDTPQPGSIAAATPTPAAAQTVAADPSDPPTYTSYSGTADPTATTGLPTAPIFLTSETPVDRDHGGGSNGGYETGPYSVSGRQYGHALTMNAYCSNRDGGDYWVEYDLARSWSTLTATVGLRDDSPASAVANYSVLLDGKPMAQGILKLGQAVPLAIPVSGGLRLRLRMNNPAAGQPTCSGEVDRTQVVWGDPKVVP